MKCIICGKELNTTDRRVHFCSDECRKTAYRQKMVAANKARRQNNPDYARKNNERALARYFERKHERFVEIAKELSSSCGDIDAMTAILEENCRLRH